MVSVHSKGSIKKSTSENDEGETGSPNLEATEELKEVCLATVHKILGFLKASKLKFQRLNYEALDFSNKINSETLAKCKDFEFGQAFVEEIDGLISLQPNQGLYGRLLTLHPSPSK